MVKGLLRFGLHDFLNARPLLVPLQERGRDAGLKLVVDVPSALADRLEKGELDLAMIPAVEYLKRAGDYRLVRGVCIASRGKVGTVLLASKVPVEGIRTLALDNRSRTSVALLKVLFADRFHQNIEFRPASPDPAAMLQSNDAALIIGDRAWLVNPKEFIVHDLSEEWFERTGKTFAHAVVAVRPGVAVGRESLEFLQQAWKEELKNISRILEQGPQVEGAGLETCRDYLAHRIIYDLSEQEIEGLLHFRDLCRERKLVQDNSTLQFCEPSGPEG